MAGAQGPAGTFTGMFVGDAGFEGNVSITGTLTAPGLMAPGMVVAFAGTVAPAGWLFCDGAAVSRTGYATLFAAIGVAHGSGDGATTFNLPDYRGRFLRGVDNGQGRDPDTALRTAMNVGGNTADAVGSVQDDMFGSHTHGSNAAVPQAAYGVQGSYGTYATPGATVSAAGGNETRPKNAVVNYLIKM
jgi:microcystin-dependent protein